jgi:predicted Zn-dependent protease
MPSTLADRPLEDNAMGMAEALFAADTEADAWINSAEVFAIEKRVTFLNSSGSDVSYRRFLVKGEFVTQCKTPQDVEQFFQFAYADLNTEALTEKARRAIAAVRDRAAAQKSPQAGTYSVVLSGDQVPTLLEYYGERAHAAMVFAHYSDWTVGKQVQGENVQGEKLNLNLLPMAPYSEDGIPMVERPLIRDGELKVIYGPNRFCRYLGIEPTGNYQRLGLKNGTVALQDLQKGCLCPVSFSDFQMDAFTGHFGGEIRLAYLYTDEGVEILTGGSINGSLPEKQGNLLFSTERYDTLTYTGPFAVKIEGVEVAG